MARIVDNIRLPEHIESGCRIGPTFSTSLNTLFNGAEESNSNWDEELLYIDAGYGIMDQNNPDDPEDSYLAVLDFFRARKGKHRAFLFRDPSDFVCVLEDMRQIPGQDRTYQLGKYYDTYFRRITRPVADTLGVFNNDLPISSSSYELLSFGRIKFNEGVTIITPTATFEFDVPVRFDQDEMSAALTHVRAGEIPDVKIIQIRE